MDPQVKMEERKSGKSMDFDLFGKDGKANKEMKEKEKDKAKGTKEKEKSKAEKKIKTFKDTKGPKGAKEKVIKPSGSTKKKKLHKKPRTSWAYYIHKVLKAVQEDDCTLSSKAMSILDSFANDVFDRITAEAVKLLRLNNKKTLTSMEIQTASRLVLPGDLCKHAIQDGAKAVSKFQLTSADN